MNLSELAEFICTKINQSETDDVAACKDFLTARAKMIWNVALWKDSLVSFAQTLSSSGYTAASTWLPTKGVLLCPTIIERVVAARLDSRRLNVQRQEYYYNIDPDTFALSGQVMEFVLLPPCVWETEEQKRITLEPDESADNDAGIILEIQQSDGVTIDRLSVTPTYLSEQIVISEAILRLSKPITSSAIDLRVDSAFILQLEATATAAMQRQRIRLLQIPTENTTIRVLGKRFMPTFENDLDTPPISGMENCLLAFCQADMLQRERQYGKAQALQQEAIGLLEQLKDMEVVQQAHHVQITPGSGFVSEYDFHSTGVHPLIF